jgi:hypothetical protein
VSIFNEPLHTDSLRQLLEGFWHSALEISQTGQNFVLAMPQTYPDGWQIVIDLHDHLPAAVRLSDGGRTLGWLMAQGQNIETEVVSGHIREICAESGIERDGLELLCWVAKGLEGVNIHVFAEALVAISHLHYLREVKPRMLDIPAQTLQQLFSDLRINVKPNATLQGRGRKDIRVDYFVERNIMAFQIIRRHGRILPTMEQWGWRWHDLKNAIPALQPAMIYDPHNQEIDPESRAIGEEVCGLFCSYEETDRIHEFLSQGGHQ